MKLTLDLKPAKSIDEFIKKIDGSVAMYQPYFHEIKAHRYHLRVVTPESNIAWIKAQIAQQKIYLLTEKVIADHI